MIKLLYKPTKLIFTLPDAEAIALKNRDISGNYIVVDAGVQQVEEEIVTEEIVNKIEEQIEESKIEQEEKEEMLLEDSEDDVDYSKFNRDSLRAICKKLEIQGYGHMTRAQMIEALNKATGKGQI